MKASRVNPRLIGFNERFVVTARHVAAPARSFTLPSRTFTTTASPTPFSSLRIRRGPASTTSRSFFSATTSSTRSSPLAALGCSRLTERRGYATEPGKDGITTAAESLSQSTEVAKSGGDAMASFISAADPVVVETTERVVSWFPPINWLADSMTFVHYAVPLSWAATAFVFTIAARTLILPGVAITMQNSARMRAVQPQLEKIKTKYAPRIGNDAAAAMMYREEVRQAMAQSGASMTKAIVPIIVQTPVFLSFFFATRQLADYEPSLHDASFLLFNDLAVADPFYIMPVLTSLTMLATIELGSDGVGGQSNPAVKNFLRFFTLIAIPATSSLPILTHIYWMSSNLFSLAQLAIFKLPAVKKALGLPDFEGLSPLAGSDSSAPARPTETFQHKPKITSKPQ